MRTTYEIHLDETSAEARRLSVAALLGLWDDFERLQRAAEQGPEDPAHLQDGIAAAVRVVAAALELEPEEVEERYTPEQVGELLAAVLEREFGGDAGE